jgi:hypothetical protein
MNYDTIVTKGLPPWLPNATATGLDVYHAYDIPLAGVFKSGATKVLFLCVVGATSESNVWIYKPLTASELKKLESEDFADPDDFEAFTHSLFEGKRAVFAYARHGRISKWSAVQVDEGVLPSAVKFLEGAFQASEDQHRRAAQARADVTKAALETDEEAIGTDGRVLVGS